MKKEKRYKVKSLLFLITKLVNWGFYVSGERDNLKGALHKFSTTVYKWNSLSKTFICHYSFSLQFPIDSNLANLKY